MKSVVQRRKDAVGEIVGQSKNQKKQGDDGKFLNLLATGPSTPSGTG
jgi:hypothetical protein